jgi:GAF domain-containing protein
LLDTGHEAQFDEIVREAASECHTPIALMTLVASNRQWFKAHHGVEVRETDIGRSICAKAIEYDGVFVVPDTRVDPRTNTNPLVVGELNIGFYAGAPLVTPDGHALGMLCVLDHHARPAGVSPSQAAALRRLADRVMQKLAERLAALEGGVTPDELLTQEDALR